MPKVQRLKDLKNPPKELFYKGEWDEKLFEKCIAIVGSRRMTEYGRRAIEKIVPQLVADGWTIVSGFMYGVDFAAHRVCVECGGKTIAVLGWGIDIRREETDIQMEQSIVESGGLILSEWKDQQPALWTFPWRNRIVAALSQEIIVVEAAIKSGSLITVEIAEKLGRKIWAVPGPITSSVSAGTNMLIASGRAEMWLSHSAEAPRDKHNNKILDILQNEGLDASEIARKLNLPIAQVGAQLSILILQGDIVEREGKYYAS